ncbi:KTSC domain-containing protein [Mycetocola zhujimingii]|uniref:KTSC domain-containing protein n=1 Tax=Mycetocola zhujimingii TaxID=2079792 RepID=A0A2U1TCQ1_9MICO|nr:hypothetical protein DF223_10445 [Mycetocola zhujimingii]
MEWQPVHGSTRVVAIAYAAEDACIYVEFPSGKRHAYEGCSQTVWEEFSDPSTSKGSYIHTNLNFHPHHPA